MSMDNQNIKWHDHLVQRGKRARQKEQKPCLIWFTGLSGAGKSTVANALDILLLELYKHT